MRHQPFASFAWSPDLSPSPEDRLRERRLQSAIEAAGLHPIASSGALAPLPTTLPAQVDLRAHCQSSRFQGLLNTCASHVVAAMLEYAERRAHHRTLRVSRLFLHLVTHRVARLAGNAPGDPVFIRQVFGTLRLFGVPPEVLFPYPKVSPTGESDPAALDREPDALTYAAAADYRAIDAYRLDPRNRFGESMIGPAALLTLVRRHAAAGLVTSLGFPLYRGSIAHSMRTGAFSYPLRGDRKLGAHAVMVVGYDDTHRVRRGTGAKATVGALRIQNSWGHKWGDRGFGWLPYDFVLRGRSSDHWALLSASWVESGAFALTF